MQRKFDESIKQHLGLAATPQDFPTEDLTPDPELYDDPNVIDPDYGDAEIKHEMGAIICPPNSCYLRVVTWIRATWPHRKKDRISNPIGIANDNPILDTQSYIINFDDGDQTELIANMMAKSLYLQCDPNGNQKWWWQ